VVLNLAMSDARAHRDARQRGAQTWLGIGAILGPVQFAIVSLALGWLRSGYSWVDQAISDLGVGENAWALNLSLIVLGATLIGAAGGVARSVRTQRGIALQAGAALFLGLVGVGYAVAGAIPETNPIHWLVGATLVYVGAIIGFLLAGVLFLRAGDQWRGWGIYSLLSSFATLVFVGATFWVFSTYTFAPGTTPVGRFGGVMERGLFVDILAWYVVAGWQLVVQRARGRPS
jgi:hypothetical membrane protein